MVRRSCYAEADSKASSAFDTSILPVSHFVGSARSVAGHDSLAQHLLTLGNDLTRRQCAFARYLAIPILRFSGPSASAGAAEHVS